MYRITSYFVILFLSATLWHSCATPGTPDGGRFDEEPPEVVATLPEFGAVNADKRKIQILFNENVRLDNASEKVVISPPQLNMPEISASGPKIKISLEDTLKPNTTYTIDFSDAILDNNEGNPMGNYTFLFSTGESCDTMEVAGYVLNAEDLEPVKGLLVGLHSDTTDTVFQKVPFERVARTNGSGRFVIRGVKDGKYKVYALKDADGSFTYNQKSEMLAFMNATFHTGSYPDTRLDTVWHDDAHIFYDSLKTVAFTHYTPDDLVLLAYTDSEQEQHFLKSERNVHEHFELYFTTKSANPPIVKGLNFNDKDAFILNKSAGNDTLQYWLTDTLIANKDTLQISMTYMETDTLGVLQEKTDTLELTSKITFAKRQKQKAEAFKKWEKEQEKLKKKDRPYQKEYPIETIDLNVKGTGSLPPNENVRLSVTEPIKFIDTTKIHLELKQDSLFFPANYIMKQNKNNIMSYTIYAEWRPKQEYRLRIDSAAMISIYGKPSNKVDSKITIPDLDKFSSVFVTLNGFSDSTVIVQLLRGDKPAYSSRCKKGKAEFYFVKPGKYYMRAFIDLNGNGKWDGGKYEDGKQAEETFYFPHELTLKAMWDVEQDWNVRDVPRYQQKPLEITKQKPDKEKTINHRNAEREKEKHRN